MFAPALPASGYLGWRFLQKTQAQQQAVFAKTPDMQRDAQHFRDTIGQVLKAEDLVKDRQLLKVALGAFGLEGDLDNRFFVQKILTDGTSDPKALANRLADKRYADFAKAFRFDSPLPRTLLPSFPDQILSRYEDKAFQRAVGEQDSDLRLAMNVESGLQDIIAKTDSGRAHWFAVMGNPPLRQVFDTALGMPAGFGALDVDKQLDHYQTRAKSVFGTENVADLASDSGREDLIRMFLLRSEAQQFNLSASRAQTALTLLSSIGNPWRR